MRRDERFGKVLVTEKPRQASGDCVNGRLVRLEVVIVVCKRRQMINKRKREYGNSKAEVPRNSKRERASGFTSYVAKMASIATLRKQPTRILELEPRMTDVERFPTREGYFLRVKINISSKQL